MFETKSHSITYAGLKYIIAQAPANLRFVEILFLQIPRAWYKSVYLTSLSHHLHPSRLVKATSSVSQNSYYSSLLSDFLPLEHDSAGLPKWASSDICEKIFISLVCMGLMCVYRCVCLPGGQRKTLAVLCHHLQYSIVTEFLAKPGLRLMARKSKQSFSLHPKNCLDDTYIEPHLAFYMGIVGI